MHSALWLALLTMGASPAAPPAPASASSSVTEHLAIPFVKYKLPTNGLEVILAEDHTTPLVATNIWYHAGPINEAPGRTGFAHLFEHLMFQGSAHVGDDQHFRILEARGASSINGTTDFDRTNYLATVPAGELPLALWLESDRMGFLLDTLTQGKLDNQRQVVMNERRQNLENAPYGPSGEKLNQLLFAPTHPYYGYVMGSMRDLNAATLEEVQQFFQAYYAPANATLVIAGDFDPASARTWVDKYFATLPSRAPPKARAFETPALTEVRRLTVQEPVALARIKMAWLTPPAFAEGDADLDVLGLVLSGGASSRLHRRLVYELELAESVGAGQQSMSATGIFQVVVTARPKASVQAIEAETLAVLAGLVTHPPTAHECRRARNLLETNLISQLQYLGGFSGRADMLNRYNQYVGDPGFLQADLARYNRVTPNSLAHAANTYLSPTARAVVTTVPAP